MSLYTGLPNHLPTNPPFPMKHDWTKGEAWGKGTAAFFGGFLAFVLFGLALGTALPLLGVPVGVAVSISVALSVPVWVGFIVWAYLAPSGRGAWLRMAITSLVFGGITAFAYFI
ncbi:MAG: hypothetical protein AAF752_11290 [Bacteroidota bacterium]